MRCTAFVISVFFCSLTSTYAEVITNYKFFRCEAPSIEPNQTLIFSKGWKKNQLFAFKKFSKLEFRIPKLDVDNETPYTIRIIGKTVASNRNSSTHMAVDKTYDCKLKKTKARIGHLGGKEDKHFSVSSEKYDRCYNEGNCDSEIDRANYYYKSPGIIFGNRCTSTNRAEGGFIYQKDFNKRDKSRLISSLGRGAAIKKSALADIPNNYRKTIIVPVRDFVASPRNDGMHCLRLSLSDRSEQIKMFKIKVGRIR